MPTWPAILETFPVNLAPVTKSAATHTQTHRTQRETKQRLGIWQFYHGHLGCAICCAVTTRQSAGSYQVIQPKATPIGGGTQQPLHPYTFFPHSPSLIHTGRQKGSLSGSLGHHSNNSTPPAPFPQFQPFQQPIHPSLLKPALFNEHTIKEETRETKTGKVCVCVWCSGCEREKAGGVQKKNRGARFCEHSRKKCWKQWKWTVSERLCVRIDAGYFPVFHCD